MRPLIVLAAALAALACPPTLAQTAAPDLDRQDVAGRFDHYVLSLSWSPAWCAREGAESGARQCAPGRRLGFTVHGLWPQHETGWPADCPSARPDPSRRETAAMADLMGSGGLAWYQWKKHGRCSGLPAQDYFALTRRAAAAIRLPETLAHLPRDITLPASVIEDAFIEANPALRRDGITVTCRSRSLQEIRICLSKDLTPRACGPDTQRDCKGSILIPAPR